eukprot:CAMPEP_0178392740 /NCGR_PEP_ID=MMETSP0689_2-20121128/11832_1 /TAXON_ID=160604 /ORGANISM="Amphidinium massartii, Strain CS-259" /LENGTH=600 /DNA_ID=CAMNT_0020013319 /DNA_START=116 /DNA_END=1918 /DNA_ORIENTATION=+
MGGLSCGVEHVLRHRVSVEVVNVLGIVLLLAHVIVVWPAMRDWALWLLKAIKGCVWRDGRESLDRAGASVDQAEVQSYMEGRALERAKVGLLTIAQLGLLFNISWMSTQKDRSAFITGLCSTYYSLVLAVIGVKSSRFHLRSIFKLVYSAGMLLLTATTFVYWLYPPSVYGIRLLVRVAMNIWMTDLRYTMTWNIFYMGTALSFIYAGSGTAGIFQRRLIASEFSSFLVIGLLLHEMQALLRAEAISAVSFRTSRNQKVAVTALLNAMCDAVVPLSDNLEILEDAPRLTAMLLHDTGCRSLVGTLLEDCMFAAEDKERFKTYMARGGKKPSLMQASQDVSINAAELTAGTIDVHLRDSTGCKLPVDLMRSDFVRGDGSIGYIIGIREKSAEEQLPDDKMLALPSFASTSSTCSSKRLRKMSSSVSSSTASRSVSPPGSWSGSWSGALAGVAEDLGGNSGSLAATASCSTALLRAANEAEVAATFEAMSLALLACTSAFGCFTSSSASTFSSLIDLAGMTSDRDGFVGWVQESVQSFAYEGRQPEALQIVVRPPHVVMFHPGVSYTTDCNLRISRVGSDVLVARLSLCSISPQYAAEVRTF